MSDDTTNRLARRVAVHQAVDRLVDARLVAHSYADALADALGYLADVARDEHPYAGEDAWRAIAAIAQGQLEQAMEARAS